MPPQLIQGPKKVGVGRSRSKAATDGVRRRLEGLDLTASQAPAADSTADSERGDLSVSEPEELERGHFEVVTEISRA